VDQLGKCHLVDYAMAPAEEWQKRTLAAEAKVVALTARIEQEIPALQASVNELEGDRLALKVALQKVLV
jgi:hypothetical protein